MVVRLLINDNGVYIFPTVHNAVTYVSDLTKIEVHFYLAFSVLITSGLFSMLSSTELSQSVQEIFECGLMIQNARFESFLVSC